MSWKIARIVKTCWNVGDAVVEFPSICNCSHPKRTVSHKLDVQIIARPADRMFDDRLNANLESSLSFSSNRSTSRKSGEYQLGIEKYDVNSSSAVVL